MSKTFKRRFRPIAAIAAMIMAGGLMVPAAAMADDEVTPTPTPTESSQDSTPDESSQQPSTSAPDVDYEDDAASTEAPTADSKDESSLDEEAAPETDPEATQEDVEEAQNDTEISPMSVPTPGQLGPNEAAVSVKVGGYREGAGNGTVTGLAGATLGLFDTRNSQNPVNEPWATCVSDADGDCTFIIPDTQPSSGFWPFSYTPAGENHDRQLWVKAIDAPASYHIADDGQLGIGSSPSPQTYAFRVGNRSSSYSIDAGNVYTSEQNFMYRNGDNNEYSNGVFQYVKDNPVINQCGIDVAMVFDLSGSVSGHQNQLVGAANSFVDELTGTDSSVSLYTFSTGSPAKTWNTNNDLIPNYPEQQSVVTQGGADIVKGWYNRNFTPSGGTNWDRGLYAPVTSGNNYEVAIVFTDGNPTFYGDPYQGASNSTGFKELEEGIFSANALKETGTRIIAVGVGDGVDSAASGVNLSAISGPTKGSDYFQTTNYDAAAQVLRDMIAESCAGNITVIKQVVDENTQGEDITGATPTGGWDFSAASTNNAVTFPGGSATASGTTSENGAVEFTLDFDTPSATTDVTIEETAQDGYTLVTQSGQNAVCIDLGSGSAIDIENSGEYGFTLENVSNMANISCTVYNRPPLPHGSLQLIKDFDLNYGGSDDLTPWTLTATSADVELEFASGDVEAMVEPGDYVIGEFYGDGGDSSVASAGYEHTSTVCTIDEEAADLDENGAIEVAAGTDVVCTLINADLPGSVEWQKISTSGNAPLDGSIWELTGPMAPNGDIGTIEIQGGELPNVATETGQFRVEDLWWGAYELTEKQAPAGFERTDEVFTFEISGAERDFQFSTAFGNTPISPGELPLTGAFNGMLPYIGGGTLLAVLGAAWYALRRKEQNPSPLLDE